MRTAFLILFLFCTYNTRAQETAVARVNYQWTYINDTTNRNNPQRDEVVTYLAQHSSYYKTYNDEKTKKDIATQKLAKDFTGWLKIKSENTPPKQFYIIKPLEHTMHELESISSSFDLYQLDVPYEDQKWEIYDEVKDIGGYNCQKATTTFKGRNYTAWFASELPFPFGPWKLHGLPGLILEAKDDLGEISYEYVEFAKLTDEDKQFIEIPKYAIKAHPKEVSKLKKAFEENQNEYFNLLANSGRMSIVNTYFDIDYSKHFIEFSNETEYEPSKTMNNPIEK